MTPKYKNGDMILPKGFKSHNTQDEKNEGKKQSTAYHRDSVRKTKSNPYGGDYEAYATNPLVGGD